MTICSPTPLALGLGVKVGCYHASCQAHLIGWERSRGRQLSLGMVTCDLESLAERGIGER